MLECLCVLMEIFGRREKSPDLEFDWNGMARASSERIRAGVGLYLHGVKDITIDGMVRSGIGVHTGA